MPNDLERNYVVEGQLMVQAPDPATAGQLMETALAAVKAALASSDTGVVISVEMEQGQFVFAET